MPCDSSVYGYEKSCGVDENGDCLYPDINGDCTSYTNCSDTNAAQWYCNGLCGPDLGISSSQAGADCNGVCGGSSTLDALGYCNGDAIIDCSGVNYYSPSNEDGNTFYDFSDYNITECSPQSVNAGGHCCSECGTNDCGCLDNNGLSPCICNGFGSICNIIWGVGCEYSDYQNVCGGNCWDVSACGEDSNGNCIYLDCLGYCNGDATLDCNGLCYSPTNEAGVNNNNNWDCNALSLDCANNCCGNAVLDDCGVCNGGDTAQDAHGVCFGPCYDYSSCGENSEGCLYTSCDGSCTSATPNPTCFSQVQSMIGQMMGIPSFINLGSPKPKVDLSALLGIPILQ